MTAANVLSFPDIRVLNVNTGEVRDMSHDGARASIARGEWIETTPKDEVRAIEWISEMRSKALAEAEQQSIDMAGFHDFELWCEETGRRSIPVRLDDTVLFLINRFNEGRIFNMLQEPLRSIAAVQRLTRHPPRNFQRDAWNAFSRGVRFARARLSATNVNRDEMEVAAAALAMFPDGKVPMRWTDVAA